MWGEGKGGHNPVGYVGLGVTVARFSSSILNVTYCDVTVKVVCTFIMCFHLNVLENLMYN